MKDQGAALELSRSGPALNLQMGASMGNEEDGVSRLTVMPMARSPSAARGSGDLDDAAAAKPGGEF